MGAMARPGANRAASSNRARSIDCPFSAAGPRLPITCSATRGKRGGAEAVGTCGEDPRDADAMVDERTEEGAGGTSREPLVATSIRNPFDALAVGRHAASAGSPIMLEDPRNLDGAATAPGRVKGKDGAVKRIALLGDRARLAKTGKDLPGKAISLEPRRAIAREGP